MANCKTGHGDATSVDKTSLKYELKNVTFTQMRPTVSLQCEKLHIINLHNYVNL